MPTLCYDGSQRHDRGVLQLAGNPFHFETLIMLLTLRKLKAVGHEFPS